MINSALTTEIGKVGIHMMKWRPFMIAFLKQMSLMNPGIIYVLFGSQAQILEPYIGKNNYVLKEQHPAYYARNNSKISRTFFRELKRTIKRQFNVDIEWFYDKLFPKE